MQMDNDSLKQTAIQVLEIEAAAIIGLKSTIDDSFCKVIQCLHAIKGKVICMGIGKSGHIAAKIAATLSSTGTPSFFMHPSEAGHGDLGMIDSNDALLVFSYSGESQEITEILPSIKRLRIPMIAIIGKADSSLAETADIYLLTTVQKEACPHNLAPTASTTASLALADALAMTLLVARGFTPQDFARTHPSGKLGKQLLLRVSDVMRQGSDIPQIQATARFPEILLEITSKRMGMALITDNNKLLGIFTDGDLRRLLKATPMPSDTVCASQLMNLAPKTIEADALAVDALQLMRQQQITQLAVVCGDQLVGALSIHDLLMHRIA